ncbi:RCC1 domain-containing protein [Streptosporangium sp. NPDC000396]|uniref:RCC1 domain-containing protein n=1 Tax=Streptosporangium sp. NPDC000396 TaxID=3366185 RepID=UPI003698AA5D
MKSAPGSLSGQIRKATTATLGVTLATLMAATGASPASAASTRVKTWGQNSEGQLGDGTTTARRTPVTAAGVTTAGVVSVTAGASHSLALLSNGTVEAWGRNLEGQLGDGAALPGGNNLTPGTVAGLSNVVAIAAGLYRSLALRSDGTVWAWGSDGNSQLGNGGANTDSPVPVQVVGTGGTGVLTNVTAIAGGAFHSLALASGQPVQAWGDNSTGQLGDGNAPNDSPFPVGIRTGVSGLTSIAGGGFHSIVA